MRVVPDDVQGKRRTRGILFIVLSLALCGLSLNCARSSSQLNNQSGAKALAETSTIASEASGSGAPVGSAIDDAPAEQSNPASPLPKPTGFVNDFAKVLDAKTRKELETTLTALKEQSRIEFAVVTVETTGEQSSLDYAMALARTWGVGAKDVGGIILLIAIKDRRWEFRWSRKLEGDLEGLVDELEPLMTTPFRQGKYSEGISAATHAIVNRLSERRGFSRRP
ncbi:MAG TPA: TPM domain-containing protein [Pyrinomonadaceae bacterium]|nr:TPM domain-containing protein [Pyrinomonadaceae bacterium]